MQRGGQARLCLRLLHYWGTFALKKCRVHGNSQITCIPCAPYRVRCFMRIIAARATRTSYYFVLFKAKFKMRFPNGSASAEIAVARQLLKRAYRPGSTGRVCHVSPGKAWVHSVIMNLFRLSSNLINHEKIKISSLNYCSILFQVRESLFMKHQCHNYKI